jgi:hypothetical protein
MCITHRLLILQTVFCSTLATSSLCLAQSAAGGSPPAPAAAAATPIPAPEPGAPEPTQAAPEQAAGEPATPAEPASAQLAAAEQAPAAAMPAEPAPAEPAADAPDAEESASLPSYFRIDHDYLFGLQLWAGATFPIIDNVGLASDIYIAENFPSGSVSDGEVSLLSSWWGEFDIGPSFTLGPVSLTPMVGIAFDWAVKKAVAINGPQLYTIVSAGPVYFESWVWTVLYSAFDKHGVNDYIHTRDWLLYQLNDRIGFGPQLEYTYDLEARSTIAFPLGGHVELAYGTGNSLGLFLGYELDKDVRSEVDGAGAEGRLTFVHNF